MEMWSGFECTLNRVGDCCQVWLLPQERKMHTAFRLPNNILYRMFLVL